MDSGCSEGCERSVSSVLVKFKRHRTDAGKIRCRAAMLRLHKNSSKSPESPESLRFYCHINQRASPCPDDENCLRGPLGARHHFKDPSLILRRGTLCFETSRRPVRAVTGQRVRAGPRRLEHGVLVLNILFSKTVWARLLSNPFFITKVAADGCERAATLTRVLKWLKLKVTVACPPDTMAQGRHPRGPGVSFRALPSHTLWKRGPFSPASFWV